MRNIRKYAVLYVMMVPVVAYFLLYGYYPFIKGLQISFQDYKLMGTRPYVGFDNYRLVWNDPSFWEAFENTVIIGGGILLMSFIAPLIVALSLNEVLQTWYKKMAQMIIYIPHLLSWVVVGGIWIFLLSPDNGLVNLLLGKLAGIAPVHFLAESDWARWMMIGLATWKDMGYNCILFLAGIVSISPSLYEAARIDGASRWQQMRYVTLPQLSGTMKVIFLLNTLGILRIFDQVFILRNPSIAAKVDVLMMYTFQKGILDIKIGPAAAASFFVVLMTLVLTLIVRRLTRFDEV
ncbi:ABC transporter permease subunit [Paenibacillus nasutitermitis]|uniref:Sugar ABC transporter permease n=1 Tax=Paenibacillus nasutitermitis TaxID=1652958 RepID=A0A916ZG00_9BACL|nr:ABC transporter permease subunit [Paenibacillus nasutitermitis]GGD95796.1 sugar ABC transporter permease [Paenibacillus nasutitermitis]